MDNIFQFNISNEREVNQTLVVCHFFLIFLTISKYFHTKLIKEICLYQQRPNGATMIAFVMKSSPYPKRSMINYQSEDELKIKNFKESINILKNINYLPDPI